MDPNVTLAYLRDAIADAMNPDHYTDREVAVEQIVEYFEDLDNWLTNGGFLPGAWSRGENA